MYLNQAYLHICFSMFIINTLAVFPLIMACFCYILILLMRKPKLDKNQTFGEKETSKCEVNSLVPVVPVLSLLVGLINSFHANQ